jgi:hypothetical protein
MDLGIWPSFGISGGGVEPPQTPIGTPLPFGKYSPIGLFVGRNNSADTVTRYGPGIEFQWEQHFSHPFKVALGPTQPTI